MFFSRPHRASSQTIILLLSNLNNMVSSAFFISALAATAQALDLRLISHNIRQATENLADGEKAWSERLPLMAAQLNHEVAGNPDTLMCFQEALNQQVEDLKSSMGDGWEYFGVGREGGDKSEYSPIFYRSTAWDIQDSRTYWLSDTPDEEGSVGWDAAYPRIVTVAKLHHKATSHDLVYMCTHFDHKGTEARRNSAELVLKIANEWSEDNTLSVFMGGDLNVPPDSEAHEVLTKELSDTIDVIPKEKHYGYEVSITGWKPDDEGDRIDYIFAKNTDGLKWVSFAILHTIYDEGFFTSDHRPVVVDVIIP